MGICTKLGEMAALPAVGTSVGRPATTRRLVLDAALGLFLQYSFAGTSLQMIADDLGLTKAAIYYHFRTREQLVVALMAPILRDMAAVVDGAQRQRTARAKAEALLVGYADVVSRNRALATVTTFDPSIRSVLRNQSEWNAVIERQFALFSGSVSRTGGTVNAAVLLTGLAGAVSIATPELDDETLRRQLVEVGRRVLDLPTQAR